MLILRIVGVMLFVGAIGCAISSTIVISDMIEDINRVSDDKENPLFGYPGKLGRIKHKYHRLYPEGRREKLLNRLIIAAAVLFAAALGLIFWQGFF